MRISDWSSDVCSSDLARMQKDPSRIAWSFCKAVRLLLLISCPVYLGMAVTAGPLVETLFGAKWRDMAPLVAILALAMPFMTLQVMRSEEHTSELQSLMRISYAVFCLKKKKNQNNNTDN